MSKEKENKNLTKLDSKLTSLKKKNNKNNTRAKLLEEIEKDFFWQERVGKNYKNEPNWYLMVKHPDFETIVCTIILILLIIATIIVKVCEFFNVF